MLVSSANFNYQFMLKFCEYSTLYSTNLGAPILVISADGSTVYFTVTNNSSQGTLWRLLVSGSSITCHTSIALREFKMMVLLSGTTFFVGGRNLSSSNGRFSKFTLGDTSATWSKSIQCPSTSCTFQDSSAILSSDAQIIYTLVAYGSPTYAIFAGLKNSNGDIDGSRYISSLTWGEAIDLFQKDSIVYAISLWSSGYTLTGYNTTSASYKTIYSNSQFLNTFIRNTGETL